MTTAMLEQRIRAIEDRLEILNLIASHPPSADTGADYYTLQVYAEDGVFDRGEHLSGGKLKGDPNMPVVANLTPDETGLKDWSEADFIRAMRVGQRKDGTAIREAMPWRAYGQMGDAELKAIYAYLRTVPPRPKGNR